MVTKDSGLTSCKSGLWQAGCLGWSLWIRGWFPGRVAAGWGSESCFYIQPGHCLYIQSVSGSVLLFPWRSPVSCTEPGDICWMNTYIWYCLTVLNFLSALCRGKWNVLLMWNIRLYWTKQLHITCIWDIGRIPVFSKNLILRHSHNKRKRVRLRAWIGGPSSTWGHYILIISLSSWCIGN